MDRKINFAISVVNITAHPNSPEIYEKLLQTACKTSIEAPQKYHGDELIDMRERRLEPLETGDAEFGGIAGEINKFTPVGDSPWYDRERGVQLPDDEKPAFDTSRFCPRLASFPFVFLPTGHRMFIVTSVNNKKLSSAYFAKSFQSICNRPDLVSEFGDIAVNVEIDKSGIDTILSIPELEKLIIRLTLPNGDDLSDMQQEWLSKLNRQNVAKIHQSLSAQRGKKLVPDEETHALMTLAQSNGYIIAEGRYNSEKVKLKSSEFPVEYKSYYSEGESIFRKLISLAKEKIGFFIHKN